MDDDDRKNLQIDIIRLILHRTREFRTPSLLDIELGKIIKGLDNFQQPSVESEPLAQWWGYQRMTLTEDRKER